MAIYTVHEPLPRKNEASANPERFAFVRDGFYFWAFVLGPFWMLWRRLWLVTVLYVVTFTAMELGLWALGVTETVKFVLGVLLALLIGFEGGTLRRWTLTRRGWRNLGVVVGDDQETAERRFFAAWAPSPVAPAPFAPSPSSPGGTPRPGDNNIVGLFPQPGAPR
jgi:hypothetical protein